MARRWPSNTVVSHGRSFAIMVAQILAAAAASVRGPATNLSCMPSPLLPSLITMIGCSAASGAFDLVLTSPRQSARKPPTEFAPPTSTPNSVRFTMSGGDAGLAASAPAWSAGGADAMTVGAGGRITGFDATTTGAGGPITAGADAAASGRTQPAAARPRVWQLVRFDQFSGRRIRGGHHRFRHHQRRRRRCCRGGRWRAEVAGCGCNRLGSGGRIGGFGLCLRFFGRGCRRRRDRGSQPAQVLLQVPVRRILCDRLAGQAASARVARSAARRRRRFAAQSSRSPNPIPVPARSAGKQPVAIAIERIDGGRQPPRLVLAFPGDGLDLLRLPCQVRCRDLVAPQFHR